ncbi:hypothetical protein V495_00141 [Pseudogymnoascus sp. VKM F-4514 (FW-929)]|nr:hypothetical protein V490_04638 [Pseudogymnoascus sp. VKM F-3557]KFY50654.1 hypothetical protein V495_00141 [Pseudogymnoascus sp. VKM F-4514 (FW-929)]KFY67505.1 hypothetical protein V497_00363 [Pseudogymnoascus sp. VKM F-4516 (FW-969)]
MVEPPSLTRSSRIEGSWLLVELVLTSDCPFTVAPSLKTGAGGENDGLGSSIPSFFLLSVSSSVAGRHFASFRNYPKGDSWGSIKVPSGGFVCWNHNYLLGLA